MKKKHHEVKGNVKNRKKDNEKQYLQRQHEEKLGRVKSTLLLFPVQTLKAVQ